LPDQDVDRITQLFVRAGLPTQIKLSAAQIKTLLGAMLLDKKVSGGEVKFVLAKKIGLKAKRRIEFYSAKLDCRLLEYELYAGSREKKAAPSEEAPGI